MPGSRTLQLLRHGRLLLADDCGRGPAVHQAAAADAQGRRSDVAHLSVRRLSAQDRLVNDDATAATTGTAIATQLEPIPIR